MIASGKRRGTELDGVTCSSRETGIGIIIARTAVLNAERYHGTVGGREHDFYFTHPGVGDVHAYFRQPLDIVDNPDSRNRSAETGHNGGLRGKSSAPSGKGLGA